MLHSVHDINPTRLNAILPTLQRIADDPTIQNRRFDPDEPPPTWSSCSTTRLPSPDPFPLEEADGVSTEELLRRPLSDNDINEIRNRVLEYCSERRYRAEVDREWERINRELLRVDQNWNRLYHGLDLDGLWAGRKRWVAVRRSMKKRWEKLGVWNSEWGVPTGIFGEFGNGDGPYTWPWEQKRPRTIRKYDFLPREEKMGSRPSPDEEWPIEHAIRMHLEKEGRWSTTLKLQSPSAEPSADIDEDGGESLIASRPWFIWQIEVAEELERFKRSITMPRLSRDDRARTNVTARWKDSWGKDRSGRDVPGWKWEHESPSQHPP